MLEVLAIPSGRIARQKRAPACQYELTLFSNPGHRFIGEFVESGHR